MTAEEKLTMAVTPQVLEDYHNTKVAPFLNPAIQYFGKDNVYSTDEKVVGQWTDKKPLYQKTINCGALVNSGKKEVSVSDLNIDNCVLLTGVAKASDTHTIYLPQIEQTDYVRADLYQNKIRIFASGTWTSYTCYITLLYTKTTDPPLSCDIGDPNEYSTDEKWVGTWVDGKKLYQKTVDCGYLTTSLKSIPHGITNIDSITECKGMWKQRDGNVVYYGPCPENDGNQHCYLFADSQNIEILATGDFIGPNMTYFVTLQYTKTS